MNLLWYKVDVERFGFSNHHHDLDIRIVHIAMYACWGNIIINSSILIILFFWDLPIYILSSTDRSVSFYQNSSVWLEILDSRSWDRNPVDSNANPRLYPSATRKPAAAKKILNGYEPQLLLFTYIRSTATESSYIYVYLLASTDRLFRCITTFQCAKTREILQAGIEIQSM